MLKYFSLIFFLILVSCATSQQSSSPSLITTQVYDNYGVAISSATTKVIRTLSNFQFEVKINNDVYNGKLRQKVLDKDEADIGDYLFQSLLPGVGEVDSATTYEGAWHAYLSSKTTSVKARCDFLLGRHGGVVDEGSVGSCIFSNGTSIPLIFNLTGEAPVPEQSFNDNNIHMLLGTNAKTIIPAQISTNGEVFNGGFTPSKNIVETETDDEHSIYSKDYGRQIKDSTTTTTTSQSTFKGRAVLIGNQGHYVDCSFNLSYGEPKEVPNGDKFYSPKFSPVRAINGNGKCVISTGKQFDAILNSKDNAYAATCRIWCGSVGGVGE